MPRRHLAALAPVLLAVIAAALLLPHSPSDLRDLVLGAGIAAPAIVLAAWVVLTPALFPGTLLAAAGGLALRAGGGNGVRHGRRRAGGPRGVPLGARRRRRPARPPRNPKPAARAPPGAARAA